METREEKLAAAYAYMRNNLSAYARYAWPGYQVSKHHQDIFDAMELLEKDEIDRLIITCPPQKGKTTSASIIAPSWILGRNPEQKWIQCSYSAELAELVSRQTREVVLSDKFRDVFGRQLKDDTQAVGLWGFQGANGYYKAVGVGGSVTGFGANYISIDDPFKGHEDADSQISRDKVWNWYRGVALTRLAVNGKVVVCQTRWHEDDLVGRCMNEDKDKWHVIHIPATDETGNSLCWPEMWSTEAYARVRTEVGERDWQALYMGRPAPLEGNRFKRSWFTAMDSCPPCKYVRAWDIAITEKTSADASVGAKVGIGIGGEIWIADLLREKRDWPTIKKLIIATAHADGKSVPILIEAAAQQAALVQDLMVHNGPLAGYIVVPVRYKRKEDKETRAWAWAARAEQSGVYMKRDRWNEEFVEECVVFPNGAHDDQVDAISIAFKYIYQFAPPPKTVKVMSRNDEMREKWYHMTGERLEKPKWESHIQEPAWGDYLEVSEQKEVINA